MLSWLAKKTIARNMAMASEGDLGPTLDEVVLKGFPWKQTICIRGRDHLDSTGDELSRRAVGGAGTAD